MLHLEWIYNISANNYNVIVVKTIESLCKGDLN